MKNRHLGLKRAGKDHQIDLGNYFFSFFFSSFFGGCCAAIFISPGVYTPE